MEEEQEWYEESPEPEPLSPATQKRILEEFKRDVDECTTDSDSIALQSIAQHYGPEGKTMSELDEIIAEYKRTTTESRMQAVRRMDGNSLQHVFAKCLYTVYESRSTEEIARSRPTKIARVSPAIKLTPVTAAPRPAKVSPPNKFPVLDERLRISSSKVRPLVSASHDVPLDRPVAQSPGPPRRRHHPALVTRQPSKVRVHHSPRRTQYDHFPHRLRRRHILAASSHSSSRPWHPRLRSPAPSSRRGQAPRPGIVEDRPTICGSLRSATIVLALSPPTLSLSPHDVACGK